MRQAVHGVVALAHCADEAGQGVNVVLSGDGTAVLINLGDRDLDGAVVLGLDDAVGGAALARDVAVFQDTQVSKEIPPPLQIRNLLCRDSLQVDDITTVVLHFGGLKRFKGLIDTDCETFDSAAVGCSKKFRAILLVHMDFVGRGGLKLVT